MPPIWKTTLRLCASIGPGLVAMHYLTWVLGRCLLGHWPRPSIDDPMSLPGLWLPCYLTIGLMLLMPVAALLPVGGAAVAALRRDPNTRVWLLGSLVSTALLVASVIFLRLDPNQVAVWMGD